MKRVVVVKADRSTVAVTAGFVTVIGGLFAVSGTGVFRWLVLAVVVFVVHRVSQMKVVVTCDAVRVVNLTGHTTLSHDGIRIIDRRDRPRWLSDAGGRMDRAGRALYLVDNDGVQVRVGVAPMFGNRLDAIADEIYRAIMAVRKGR